MKANYGEAPCSKSDWFVGEELHLVCPTVCKGSQNRRGTSSLHFTTA